MVSSFWRDLEVAKTAEEEVLSVLSQLAPEIEFIDVSDNRDYFYKGDILAKLPDGNTVMIEVKRDTCIGKTGNVLCQDEKKYWDKDFWQKGTMHSDYEIYCVVSPQLRRIYVIDFKILFAHYKDVKYRVFENDEGKEIIYLVPLDYIQSKNGLLWTIDY